MTATVRLLRVPLLVELSHRSRFLVAAAMVVVQVALLYFLWRALYSTTVVAGGLTADQAVTYVIMAVLVTRVRWGSRVESRDSLRSLVRDGRIAYWFVRPLRARRYYLTKVLGEISYWGTWSASGFALALSLGLVSGPASGAAAVLAGVSLLLGQVIGYHLVLVLDLLCFWTTANNYAVRVFYFTHDFLSGAFVPLWYLPVWLGETARWLPFQGMVNTPISLYVGRIPAADAAEHLAMQVVWCVVLALCTRELWRRAEHRVEVQGG